MTGHQVAIQRLRTGVAGLDAVLGGGLPEFSFNLIAGLPGCGKTTLAHQLMFALATPERPAIYFTVLGEPPLKMLRHQQQFGFFDAEAIQGAVRFVNLSEEALAGDLERVLARIVDEVTMHAPALVFVDSFCAWMAAGQAGDPPRDRLHQVAQQLGLLMTSWQATTFLIGEYADETDADPVFSVCDGLIWLRQSVQRNSMVRKMEIVKMRGQPTLPGLHTFRMGSAGIEVFPPAPVGLTSAAHGGVPPTATRLGMGVAGLDEMLGGGLPGGYSLLVAGPSGSGKSLLAAAFLAEGARRGERGLIAAFEQNPNRARDHIVADLIAGGQVGLIESRNPDLSIDEIVGLLLQRDPAPRCHARGDRFALGLRAGAGTDLPTGFP